MDSRRQARLTRTAQADGAPADTAETLEYAEPVLVEPITSEILTSTGPLPGQPNIILPAPSAPISLPRELVDDPAPSAVYVDSDPPAVPIAGFTFIASFLAMVISCFVAWALPLALIVLVMAVIAVRRPFENRSFAWWALVMSALAVIYSTVWLVWVLGR